MLVLRLVEPGNRLGRSDALPMLGLGCLGVAVSQTSFTFGVSLTSTANTGLVFATAPVWGLLLGFALGLERPTRWGVLGVASPSWAWARSSARVWWASRTRASRGTA